MFEGLVKTQYIYHSKYVLNIYVTHTKSRQRVRAILMSGDHLSDVLLMTRPGFLRHYMYLYRVSRCSLLP